MNKYIYLFVVVVLHILWLFWLAHNNIWHRNIEIWIDNLSPGESGYIPFEYKLSKALFYIYSIGIIVIHGLFISKSNSKPLTKLLIEVTSLLAIVVVVIIFIMTWTVRIEYS